MAQLTLDILEYDSLRNSNSEKDKTIEKLEKEIEGLKSFSRVIKEVEYLQKPMVSEYSYDIYQAMNSIMNASSSSLVGRNYLYNNLFEAVSKNYKKVKSTQYINFEDIKEKINSKFESEYKEIFKQKSEELDSNIQLYRERLKDLDAKYLESHREEINKYKSKIESLNKEHIEVADKLNEQIRELSKSKQEKVAELKTQLDTITQELAKYNCTEIKKKKFKFF